VEASSTPPDSWLEDWLRLTLVAGVGPVTQRRLLKQYGSPGAALAAPFSAVSPELPTAQAREAWRKGADPDAVATAMAWAAQPGRSVATLADPGYPPALLQISDPPSILYVLGRVDLLTRPGIAIVGSRNATASGLDTARSFARSLSHGGLTIISGLAIGIDAAAHEGGLLGQGNTVAVVGTGADIVYPSRHRELAHRIADQGAIVSEFPLGTRAASANFPRRNRIISALSRGVLVVEAALRSGSLGTAKHAGEQGRDVFAIPGSIHSPLSKGCHALIKQGAKLVESAEDVFEELRWPGVPARAPEPEQAEPDDPVLVAMGFDPCDIETLAARTGLPIDAITARLLELELSGAVASLPGGRFERVR
jgi:DNA processing protein